MGANYFTASGVSVTPDWTVLATKELGAAYTGRAITFELKNAGAVGTDEDLHDIEIQVRPHASANWFTIIGAEAVRTGVGGITRVYSEAVEAQAGTVTPSNSLYLSAILEPCYAVRVRARTIHGSTTADIHANVDSDEPWSDGVAKSLFDADTVLAADTDDTPAALTVAANSVVCRAGGNIEALAVAASTVLGRAASGDLTDLTAANVLSLLRLVCTWQEPQNANEFTDGHLTGGGAVSLNAITLAVDTLYALPFISFGNVTYDHIGIYVGTAEAGKSMDLGIYECGSDGYPSDLYLDAGTVSLASTGQKRVTGLANQVPAGLYWTAGLTDATSAKLLGVHRGIAGRIPTGETNLGNAQTTYLLKGGQTYGSGFPDPFPASPTQSIGTYSPRFALGVA